MPVSCGDALDPHPPEPSFTWSAWPSCPTRQHLLTAAGEAEAPTCLSCTFWSYTHTHSPPPTCGPYPPGITNGSPSQPGTWASQTKQEPCVQAPVCGSCFSWCRFGVHKHLLTLLLLKGCLPPATPPSRAPWSRPSPAPFLLAFAYKSAQLSTHRHTCELEPASWCGAVV